MDKYADKTGFSFGNFVVIERTNILTKKGFLHKCRCKCGNIVEIPTNYMRKGYKMDCGCQKENRVNHNKKYNRIEIEGDIAKIYFFNSNKFAMIDVEDIDKIKNLCFYNREKNYPTAYLKGEKVRLHNIILPNENKKLVIDHINRNPLDNRKCNLRIVTHAQNMRNTKLFKTNTTGYKHISFCKKSQLYRVAFEIDHKYHYVGSYRDLETAVQKLEEYKKENNI